LEELGPPVRMHAVAVGEVEPERVEPSARHRDAEAGAFQRILEREEDAGPPLLTAQLGHFALDPDGRKPAEPRRDAAVERTDREDAPVAVVDRFDLHRASMPRRRGSGEARESGTRPGSPRPSRARSLAGS